MVIMRNTKSCGCLIGTAVIESEKARRKNESRIKEITTKLKNIKDTKKTAKLKAEKKELMIGLKETISHKKKMKKRFQDHIKNSGYVPPKLGKS